MRTSPNTARARRRTVRRGTSAELTGPFGNVVVPLRVETSGWTRMPGGRPRTMSPETVFRPMSSPSQRPRRMSPDVVPTSTRPPTRSAVMSPDAD